jgi:hypothetical protein
MNRLYRDSYESLVGSVISEEEKKDLAILYKHLKKQLWFEPQTPTRVFDCLLTNRNEWLARWNPKKLCKTLLKAIGNYLQLPYQYIQLTFEQESSFLVGPAASFEGLGEAGGEIHVVLVKEADVTYYLAVLIHEMMHYFYFGHRTKFDSSDEEEFSCDFGAIYLGLGRYLILGYQPLFLRGKNVFGGVKELQLGYLNPKELGYCEAHYAYGFGTGNIVR